MSKMLRIAFLKFHEKNRDFDKEVNNLVVPGVVLYPRDAEKVNHFLNLSYNTN